jgi:hypothetical protein
MRSQIDGNKRDVHDEHQGDHDDKH